MTLEESNDSESLDPVVGKKQGNVEQKPLRNRNILQNRPLLAQIEDDFDDFDLPDRPQPNFTTKEIDGLITGKKKKKGQKQQKPKVSLDQDLEDFINDAQGFDRKTSNKSTPITQVPKEGVSVLPIQANRKMTNPQQLKTSLHQQDVYSVLGRHSTEEPATGSRDQAVIKKCNAVASKGCNDFTTVLYEAYKFLFTGEMLFGIAENYQSIFNGKLHKSTNSTDFHASEDMDTKILKHTILTSGRLAFHIVVQQFTEMNFEMPSHSEIKKIIEEEDGMWFLGGEDFLWNQAIERGLPRLERMIKKDNQFFMHRLTFGQNKDQQFSVFEFRREVIRSIWANLNLELMYYTNANVERFSIQAEKDILRNMLIHLAEPPLGYPVYASGAQTVYF